MHKIKLLFFLTLLVIIISCKDEPSTTPTPTPIEVEDEWPNFVDTGANIMAYKIDGKIRVSKNRSTERPDYPIAGCMYLIKGNPKQFYIEGNRIYDNSFQSVNINLHNVLDTGYYKLIGVGSGDLAVYIEGKTPSISKDYTTNDIDSGYIYITKLDTVKHIVTGKFAFTARYFFGTEKKKITNGQFDLKY